MVLLFWIIIAFVLDAFLSFEHTVLVLLGAIAAMVAVVGNDVRKLIAERGFKL